MVHIIPASEGCFASSVNQTFFFLFSVLLSLVNKHNTNPHLHQRPFLLSQFFYNGHVSMPGSPYSYAPSDHNGSTLLRIFYFYIHIFLFSFHLFHFYFWGISYHKVCGHTFHISGTAACIVYYMHPMLFLFQFFLLFLIFNFS